MALGTDQMTITTGDVFLPEVWSKETQKATEATLVLANLVKRFDSELTDGGDILRVPMVSNLTANAKAANTQVTLNAPTESQFTMNINRHFEASYLVEDRLKAQSKYNLLDQYSSKSGYAIAAKIDSDIAGLYSGLSQTVGNSTTDITDANIVRAIQYLDDANAPQSERYFVIKPAGLAHIRQIDKFSRFDSLGVTPTPAAGAGGLANMGGAIRRIGPNGFLGTIYNVEVYMSTNLTEESGTSDIVHNLLFQKEAFALGIQSKPRTQFQYKQEYLGTLATTDALWGFGEYRDTFGVSKLAHFARNGIDKLREVGGKLKQLIPSRAFRKLEEGVETMYEATRKVEDIGRTMWRHIELDRNTPAFALAM